MCFLSSFLLFFPVCFPSPDTLVQGWETGFDVSADIQALIANRGVQEKSGDITASSHALSCPADPEQEQQPPHGRPSPSMQGWIVLTHMSFLQFDEFRGCGLPRLVVPTFLLCVHRTFPQMPRLTNTSEEKEEEDVKKTSCSLVSWFLFFIFFNSWIIFFIKPTFLVNFISNSCPHCIFFASCGVLH